MFVKLGIILGSIEVIPSLERGWMLGSPPYGVWVNVVGICIKAELYCTGILKDGGRGALAA